MALVIPSSSIPTLPSSSSLPPTQSSSKSKKRARFADENEDENKDRSISSFITFNSDDPPLKKPRQPVPGPFDHIDSSDNDVLRKGMYLAFIDTAFTERTNGHFERYEQFLTQFDPLVSSRAPLDQTTTNTTSHATSVPRIQGWLGALTSMVSRLDRTHSILVEKVISLPWTALDDGFVNAYSRFVNGLVSARSEWIQLVLDKLVRGFRYKSIPLESRSANLSTTVNRRLIYQRLHSLLRSVLRLIPTLPSILWPLLDAHFPNKREHRDAHVCYTTNLLKIACYCPELSAQIVQLCVDKCLKIDVEIQVEVEEWEDDEGRLDEEIFGKSIDEALDKSWADDEDEVGSDGEDEDDGDDLDFDDMSSDDGHLSEDDDNKAQHPKAPSAASVKKVKKLAAKLDGMMRCMFDHLQQLSFGVGLKASSTVSEILDETSLCPNKQEEVAQLDPQRQFDREITFDLLLSNFESSILRTRRTRHTQFLIFWYASHQRSFADSLLASLVECALYGADDTSLSIVTRVAAVSYIASLVSRARYIDQAITRHVVSLLCARLELGLSRPATNANAHAIWYAIAQAVFYIFCFRWKDLLEEEEEEEIRGTAKATGRWVVGLKVLDRAISSSLNPLKICASTVVAQFAKIAHETNFVYCYPILRANAQRPTSTTGASKPTSGLVAGSAEEPVVKQVLMESQMDSFFPFDPCRLPLCKAYLGKIYREWEGGVGDDDDDDEEEEDEEC